MSLLTVEQLVEREPALGTRARVYQMVREGLLPAIRAGRRVLVDTEQVEALEAERRQITSRRLAARACGRDAGVMDAAHGAPDPWTPA